MWENTRVHWPELPQEHREKYYLSNFRLAEASFDELLGISPVHRPPPAARPLTAAACAPGALHWGAAVRLLGGGKLEEGVHLLLTVARPAAAAGGPHQPQATAAGWPHLPQGSAAAGGPHQPQGSAAAGAPQVTASAQPGPLPVAAAAAGTQAAGTWQQPPPPAGALGAAVQRPAIQLAAAALPEPLAAGAAAAALLGQGQGQVWAPPRAHGKLHLYGLHLIEAIRLHRLPWRSSGQQRENMVAKTGLASHCGGRWAAAAQLPQGAAQAAKSRNCLPTAAIRNQCIVVMPTTARLAGLHKIELHESQTAPKLGRSS